MADHGVRGVLENLLEYNQNVKIMHLAWILELQNKCKNNTSCQNMGPWAMGPMGPMGPMSPGPKGSWLGRGLLGVWRTG